MLILLGLLFLVILFIPTGVAISLGQSGGSHQIEAPSAFPIVLAIALALVVAALLFYSAARNVPFKASPAAREPDRRRAMIAGILGFLLLVKSLHTLYWLLVWDSTYDPIGQIWTSFILFIVFLGCVLMAIVAPPGRRGFAWLLVLAMPLLILGFVALVQPVDFRQLTAARAERVNRAIIAYHEREGVYPDTLRQLVPRDLLALPQPVILFGQTWCYENQGSAYRLGYVDRRHWSDPNLFGHFHSGRGELAALPGLCATEIAALQIRNPDYFLVGEDR